jgi:nitroreductase
VVFRELDCYAYGGEGASCRHALNIGLVARAERLGGVLTTMLIRQEDAVKQLLGAPEQWALAAGIALGHPVRQPRRLRRAPVGSFATVDRVDGAVLEGPE